MVLYGYYTYKRSRRIKTKWGGKQTKNSGLGLYYTYKSSRQNKKLTTNRNKKQTKNSGLVQTKQSKTNESKAIYSSYIIHIHKKMYM